MDRERIQAILQLNAVFNGSAPRLNDVFDTMLVHGMKLEDLPACSRQDLIDRLYFPVDHADQFLHVADWAEHQADRISGEHLTVITRADELWPVRVQCQPVSGMMPWLCVVGDPDALSTPAIGIGGSRDATSRSLEITGMLAERCVAQGATVVSGGARGVDSVAHRAALESGGRAVVVLAQGIGTFQIPPEWWEPITQGQLVIVSEFSPLAQWESHQALQRNGTVVRLSDAFVVAQAELKSGTSSAGRSALRLKRPLYVVSQTGEDAEIYAGSEQLIAEGGKPLVVPDDGPVSDTVLAEMLAPRPPVEEAASQMRLL